MRNLSLAGKTRVNHRPTLKRATLFDLGGKDETADLEENACKVPTSFLTFDLDEKSLIIAHVKQDEAHSIQVYKVTESEQEVGLLFLKIIQC